MQATATDLDLGTGDLGPLAWVLDELRKSLESASSALRRFVRDAAQARGTDMASVDAGQLRIARQQLHQAVGALEMVGLAAPARMLRAMEAAVQKFVERPALCTEQAASQVERAGFALTEYLESVLLAKPVSAVSLFPQYRQVQELLASDRIHPADLWGGEWRWIEIGGATVSALAYEPALRSRMDQSVLRIVKTADAAAASKLAEISLGLAAAQTARQPRIFWKLAAGYFEAVAKKLLPSDVYVKRAASRVLLQYASLAKGELGVSDRLAQDLAFFCAQAQPAAGTAPAVQAVREAYGLTQQPPADYERVVFGRFDPVLLSQLRKRIAAAKETWSLVSGGEATKLRAASEHFQHLRDTLGRLSPASEVLGDALSAAVDTLVRGGRPPAPEFAMEVATAILYLEAAFQDLDLSDDELRERTGRLAQRVVRVAATSRAEPLEPWMEELYRRVSDRQTMGSVVGELRSTLSELEKLLDQFFRQPQDKTPLRDAPAFLSQMRGVLSVLGLDQATLAVARMREAVEQIILNEVDEAKARAAGTFEKLGNNLGALGFLIDMLNYQPSLAKKLFVYDDQLGELRPLMGRTASPVPQPAPVEDTIEETIAVGTRGAELVAAARAVAAEAAVEQPAPVRTAAAAPAVVQPRAASAPAPVVAPAVAPVAAPAPVAAVAPVAPPVVTPVAAPVAATVEDDDGEEELRGIFLDEAREVVGNGHAALQVLATAPAQMSELTTLRRAFHTLKGSSRMVGLNEFGEAGWAMEQLLNTWLADQKPASDELRTLAKQALDAFALWVEDIAARRDGHWKATSFRTAAEAMRAGQGFVAIEIPGAAQPEPVAAVAAEVVEAPPAEIVFEPVAEVATPAPLEPPALEVPADIDLSVEPEQLPAVDLSFDFAPSVSEEALPTDTSAEAAALERVPDAIDLGLSFDIPEPAAAQAASQDVLQDAPIEVPLAVELAPLPAPIADAVSEQPAPQEADALADFEFDLDGPIPDVPAAAIEMPPEIAGIDFGSLSAISAQPELPREEPAVAPATLADVDLGFDAVEPTASEPAVAAEASLDFDFVESVEPIEIVQPLATEPVPAAEPEPVPVAQAEPEIALANDEQVKVIGSLRIGIPLYNVFLNEADEWSRRLNTELSEWALEPHQPLQNSTVGWAHALAGSSATVGFHALSDVARALEAALMHAQTLVHGTPEHAKAFTAAAEEIRRLLHQFAAGFLKEADPRVLPALSAARELPVPVRSSLPTPSWMEGLDDEEALPELQQPVAADAVETLTDSEPFVPQAITFVEPMPVVPTPVVESTRTSADAGFEGDEDIDVADAIDPDLFQIFEEEATELMPQLGAALRQWAARPDNRGARDQALRVLHTLKGSARLAGALRLGEMAHRVESEIEYLGSEGAVASDIELLLQRFDNLQARFEALRSVSDTPAVTPQPATPPTVPAAPVTNVIPLVQPTQAAAPDEATPPPLQEVPVAPEVSRAIAMPVATTMTAARQNSNQTVRVRAQLLDRLVNQAGEVMITRSRLEAELRQLRTSLGDLTGNLDRLRTQLRDIELQAETQMQSRLALSKDSAANFDPLEFDRFTRVQELTRMMAESVNDVATVQRNIQRVVESTEDDLIAQARQTRELQRDLLRTRMVEFEGIADRLYRVVRLAAKETGKQVKLDIVGGTIEMDRGVLDRMTPAFEHLLRNCVAHGVETPEVRTAAGKDGTGTILIHLQQEGNDVSVEFRDDGAGLNISRIRDKALQQGLIPVGHVLTDAEAANMIFMPGFSTANSVTELAGRGIGMDVVRSEVVSLGGRIETNTQPGQGTSFRLVLPLTTAVTQVVIVRAGALTIGVPANLVELVRRVTGPEMAMGYDSGSFEFAGEQLAFHWAGALLQSSARSAEPQGKTTPVVVFRSAAQRVAVHVDEVLGNQEVVVKNLGPQLAKLPGLAGMTVLASGAVVLIYNPVALAQVYGEQARQLTVAAPSTRVLEQGAAVAAAAVVAAAAEGLQAPPIAPMMPTVQQVPLVLVVDDSITVRRVTQRLLQREGYRVALAADGLQALERLAEERPAVVLSDIEMPRMDGFDLARNIRSDARLKDLPIVMITSRIAEKHREHARQLGVNHYLGKPYSEDELLGLVRHYSGADAAVV